MIQSMAIDRSKSGVGGTEGMSASTKGIICHLATVHTGLDVRIYHKQVLSLVRAGYKCHLVMSVSPAEAARARGEGVHVHALPDAIGQSRLSRMFIRPFQALRLILRTRATVVHFHDPELMPLGLLLKVMGRKVIMDSHEFLPDDVLTKDWIPERVRVPLAAIIWGIQRFAARRYDAVVAATPHIGDRFRPYARRCVTLNNFPVRSEIESALPTDSWADRRSVIYAGVLTAHRCVKEMVDAAAISEVPLLLAGSYTPDSYRMEVQSRPGWSNVIDMGQVDRDEVLAGYRKSFCGIVLWAPIPNYMYGVPNKLLEYMGAGIPVLASDLPGMKEFVLTHEAGLCVDPYDVKAIAEAIGFFRDNPEEARRMGQRGLAAVRDRFNWDVEEKDLLALYREFAGA